MVRVMMLGVALLVSGWLMVSPRSRRHALLSVAGVLVITAGMLAIVQARY
jgi:hypothetical protein